MAFVLELAPLDQSWAQWLGRRLALQGLNASHFIRANDMGPQRLEHRRVSVQRTDGLHRLRKGDRVRLGRIQPIATTMRLEIGLSFRNAPPNRLGWGGRFCVFSLQ